MINYKVGGHVAKTEEVQIKYVENILEKSIHRKSKAKGIAGPRPSGSNVLGTFQKQGGQCDRQLEPSE